MAPEIDWSEFTTEPPGEQPAAEAVDWSQFSTTPDDADPPMADFSNASGGSASVPLAQFDDAIVGYDTNGQPILAPQGRGPDLHLKSGYQGIAEDYQYPEDERRKVGLGEGMARSAFDTLSSFPSAAYHATPLGLLDAAAQAAGYRTPESVLTEHAHKNLGMDEESLRFAGAREEAIARAVPELVANLIPLGGAGELQRATRVVDDFVAPEARAIMDAHPAGRDMAAAGELGPEAQGSAIADDILERSAAAQAERAAAAPEVVPAERAEPVQGEAGRPVGDESGTVEGAQAQEQNVAPAAPESAVEVSELSPEDLPPEFRSRLQQQETPTVEATPEELAALQRQSRETINPDDVRVVPKEEQTFVNNGSGDVQGVGSVEAGGRVIEDKDLGRTRAVIERNGEVRPLVGVDAVDTHARPGQVIVQRGIGSDEWTILSHGDDLPPRLAKSRINAERAKLDELHAARNEDRGPSSEPIDVASIPFESADAVPPRLRGYSRAEAIRGDTRPPAVAREVSEGVGANRGSDVQRASVAGRSIAERVQEPRGTHGAVRDEGPPSSVDRGGFGDASNPSLPSRGKEMLKVRGIWDSATDVLKRSPEFKPLGEAIENHYDLMQRREGETAKFLREPVKSASKEDRASFEAYQAAIQNGRESPKLTPGAKKLVDAWKQFAQHSGTENQRVGVRVFDPKLGKVRPIGQAKDFFPRTIKREFADAMRDPVKHKASWDKMVSILKEHGVIDSEEEAGRFLRNHFSDETSNDYFAGIEKARTEPLPEPLYDYSVDAGLRYAKRWSERLSQIEAFGQKLGPHEKDLFDLMKGKTTDEGTKAYIDAVGKIVYNVRSTDDIARFAQTLNALATGLQLGNPATSALNLIGGLFQNVSTFGARNAIRAIGDLRRLSSTIRDAHEIGVLRGDYLDILHDNEVMDVPSLVRKATEIELKIGGYNFTEAVNRVHGFMIARSWLREALKAEGGALKQYKRLIDKTGADFDKLKAGDKAETERFYRKAVNEAQFSYNLSQTPVYANTAVGKFLLKYQKFGLQMSRFYWQNILEPFVKSPNLRTGGAVLRYWAAAAIGGGAIASLREGVFGYQNPAPDMSEIRKALSEGRNRDAIALASEKAWYAQLAIGGLGFFSNYVQMAEDIADRQRVKNPLNPPAISPLVGLGNLALTLYDQKGNGFARAMEEFANANLSAYRTGKRIAGAATGYDAAQRDYAFAKKMTRRYADDRNIDAKRRAPSDIVSTPMTPINRDIHDALLAGDVKGAKKVARDYISGLKTAAEQRAAWASMKSSVRFRQPSLVSVSPSAAERRDFLSWAQSHLEKPEYDRIRALDDRYRQSAVSAGFMKAEDETRTDRTAAKRDEDRAGPLSADALDKMLGDSE